MFLVKLAVALALCGGVSRREGDTPGGVRGDVHLLLIGDPGIGEFGGRGGEGGGGIQHGEKFKRAHSLFIGVRVHPLRQQAVPLGTQFPAHSGTHRPASH
jgi:DNA replicative helicase MCM subunit Mcm2 (Cdc46/Mcm family)